MNAENEIIIQNVDFSDIRLPFIICGSIGNPSPDKISKTINSYSTPNHEMIGALIDGSLIGILGFLKTNNLITIRHISVLKDFQKHGVGRLLMNEIKNRYEHIAAETDEESVIFYIKSGFSCCAFQGPHGNLRYQCNFIKKH